MPKKKKNCGQNTDYLKHICSLMKASCKTFRKKGANALKSDNLYLNPLDPCNLKIKVM